MWPLRVVEISGPSMVPTLRHGDVVLAVGLPRRRRLQGVSAGHVVLARFRSMPQRLVVKRAAHPVDDGWWLASDNPLAAGDSQAHGVADVEARVVLLIRGHGRPRVVR